MSVKSTLKKWIKKLKPRGSNSGARLHATVIPRDQHPISRKAITKNALNVLYRLNKNGYEAYLVGGCVRDLLLGLRPKDFDVATDARPEEVRRLFSNCRLIGKRFRLAHVYFGHEVIEVATFRATQTKQNSKQMTSDTGMLLRDNVFGTVDEDAIRRDFTVNALYYRVSDFALVDFCQGMQDIEARILRLIGDPPTRYREDPVRMLRAARFAAKLNFNLHQDTQAPITDLAHLLAEVPNARLFEECLKLFLTGHGAASLNTLRELGLLVHLMPESKNYHEDDWTLVQAGLKDTDQRIAQHATTSPGYLFAVLLWPMYTHYVETSLAQHLPPLARKHEAMDQVFHDLYPSIAVPKRISVMTMGIWELQHRLENVKQHQVARLLTHPYFRAAFDFLKLRCQTQSQALKHTVQWWETIQTASEEERAQLCAQLPKQAKKRQRRKPKEAKHEE